MLFGDLFLALRNSGMSVSLSDWMGLMDALSKGVIEPDLTDFYYVARALLVKDEGEYDIWDQVFAAVFADGEMPTQVAEDLMSWLTEPKPLPEISPEMMAQLEQLPLDELRKLFEERMAEQTERHDGGNRWIGTGGTSPFGHGGVHPAGVRVGGQGRNRSAVQIASKRQFRAYRNDRVLDTRSLSVALKKLRRLSRVEGDPELDIEETVTETCQQAGDLTLVFQPPRENTARVLLMMDVGGSMDPYAQLAETLFSAASNLNHWKRFDSYFFHNCPYETVYPRQFGRDGVPTMQITQEKPKDTFLIMVGDASMAPSELTESYGAIDYWHRNETAGIVWLQRLAQRFPRTVWLNPMPPEWWGGWSTRMIRRVFPMFPLTLEGLDEAVETLTGRTKLKMSS